MYWYNTLTLNFYLFIYWYDTRDTKFYPARTNQFKFFNFQEISSTHRRVHNHKFMQSKHVRKKNLQEKNHKNTEMLFMKIYMRRYMGVCVCILHEPKRKHERDMYDVRVQNTQSTQRFCLCNNIQPKNKIDTLFRNLLCLPVSEWVSEWVICVYINCVSAHIKCRIVQFIKNV